MFSTYDHVLARAPIIFSINLCIINCFENSDRAENFRQTVPIYGRWRAVTRTPPPHLNLRHSASTSQSYVRTNAHLYYSPCQIGTHIFHVRFTAQAAVLHRIYKLEPKAGFVYLPDNTGANVLNGL